MKCKICSENTISLWSDFWCGSSRPMSCCNCNTKFYRENKISNAMGDLIFIFSPYAAIYFYFFHGVQAVMLSLALAVIIWGLARMVETRTVKLQHFTYEVAVEKHAQARFGIYFVTTVIALIVCLAVFI